MLVLTRKKEQSLILNDNIEVIVLEVQGDQVRLGIKAPRSISVYRKEVYEEISKANKEANDNTSANSNADLKSIFSKQL